MLPQYLQEVSKGLISQFLAKLFNYLKFWLNNIKKQLLLLN